MNLGNYGYTNEEYESKRKALLEREQKRRRFFMGAAGTGFGILVLAILFFMTSAKVDPGYAGVVYSANGGLEETTYSQGWHFFIAPWKSVRQYPISTETVWLSKAAKEGSKEDDSFNTSTMEGKPVNVDAYYTYHIDVKKLPQVFNKFKGVDVQTIENGYLRQQVKSAAQSVTSGYSVMDLYGNKRGEIQLKIQDTLVKELAEFGIDVETFAFGEVRPDAETMKAIQAKVDAQQKLQQMEIELQQAKVTADKQRVEAQGNSDKKVIEAQGEAKANSVVQASLTPELIQKLWIDRWNGAMPQVSGSSNQMINIPLK